MPKQSKMVGKRMDTAVLYHLPIVLPIYNPPSSPAEADRLNRLIDPLITNTGPGTEMLSKHERGVVFKKKKSKFLIIEQLALKKSIYAIV